MFGTDDSSIVQKAIIKMINASGFLPQAGLTEADAKSRLSLDFAHDAVILDITDCAEHASTLIDYATLYGPAVLNAPLDISAEEAALIIRVRNPETNIDIAAEAEDYDDIDDDEDDTDEDEDDSDEDDEDDDEESDDPSAGAAAKARIPEEDRLRVLITPEMHKVASRIFAMLGDSADMAAYASFLRAFDNLLVQYGGIAAQPRNPDSEETKEAITESAFAIEMAALGDLLIEEARRRKKKKKGWNEGRSGLLSAIMKGLSGEKGERIQSAWDNLKPDAFSEAMGNVVSTAVAIIQKELEERGEGESKDEDSSSEDNSSTGRETEEDAAEVSPAVDEKKIPLCAMAKLLNGDDLVKWAREQGFTHITSPEDLHVTVAYSKEPIDPTQMPPFERIKLTGMQSAERSLGYLGENKALVLHLGEEECAPLKERWQKYRDLGASWDYDSYKCHLTISYKEDFNEQQLQNMKPYLGSLIFDTETVKELKPQADGSPGFDVNKIPHITL